MDVFELSKPIVKVTKEAGVVTLCYFYKGFQWFASIILDMNMDMVFGVEVKFTNVLHFSHITSLTQLENVSLFLEMKLNIWWNLHFIFFLLRK